MDTHGKRVKEFERMLAEIFDKNSKPSLYILTYILPVHIEEDVKRFGTLPVSIAADVSILMSILSKNITKTSKEAAIKNGNDRRDAEKVREIAIRREEG